MLITTFTNPTPEIGDSFGEALAAVGSDRVLVGAHRDDTGATNSGAAYLFSTDGTLLTTFTNPSPAVNDNFGYSVAALGSESVLISAIGDDTGATNAGVAYLFKVDGTLLTTFTNPAPTAFANLGSQVAALGTDRLLLGAGGGAGSVGLAYLFTTNGTLLTVFTNPTPASAEFFGGKIAALGSDRVLIASTGENVGVESNVGVAYLFNTNGALLATFTNPTPAELDYFGWSMTAVGTDLVVIGAFGDTAFTGAAYLSNTNGTLLTTITNPAPDADDEFGDSVVAVGNDLVVIGASGEAGHIGVAYLFSTNGTLLTTITNPSPAGFGGFGIAAAAAGSGRFLIGARSAATGASSAGVAYLFDIFGPALTFARTATNTVAISWPSPSTDFILQQNTNAFGSINWSNVTDTVQDDGTNRSLIIEPSAAGRFYRLFKQ